MSGFLDTLGHPSTLHGAAVRRAARAILVLAVGYTVAGFGGGSAVTDIRTAGARAGDLPAGSRLIKFHLLGHPGLAVRDGRHVQRLLGSGRHLRHV